MRRVGTRDSTNGGGGGVHGSAWLLGAAHAEFGVARDDETAAPRFHVFALEERSYFFEESAACGMFQANEQQSRVRAGEKNAHVGEAAIGRDQEPLFGARERENSADAAAKAITAFRSSLVSEG